MNLSKSRYCEGLTCPKKLWLSMYKSEVSEEVSETRFDAGTNVGILAKDLLGEHVDLSFDIGLDEMINKTKSLLKKDKIIITEASFNYNDNFCSVDILKKDGNNIELYEVKSSTSVNDIYIDDISYQYYVVKNNNYNVSKCFIVTLNNKYYRHGNLELDKLFNINDVTDMVLEKQNNIKDNINNIKDYISNKEEKSIRLDTKCENPYHCPFFSYCTKDLVKPNVFDIKRMPNNKKFSLYNKGIISYEDLLKEDINELFKEQIEFELYEKDTKINKDNIKEFMKTLSYPLYFLDFETYQEIIPSFDNVNPYMQMPFQYSLHYIEKENGELKHKEFLAESGIDPRRSLAESLVRDIPKDVCVLAYNMSFEKSVIKKLASIYPDLEEHLLNIYNNIKDLMIPFKNRDYYNKDMKGSYSIKFVLPALFPNDPKLDYHNLELIHKGDEASSNYVDLINKSEEERKYIKERLLRYCELDTYAMVKIWEVLKNYEN